LASFFSSAMPNEAKPTNANIKALINRMTCSPKI